MSTFNKFFLILALGLVTVIGAAGAAGARGGCCGYGQEISPEAQKILQSARDNMAPLVQDLRAKREEFTAKVYSGADSKVTDALRKDIVRLQTQVTEARLTLQQDLAAAGVPQREARGMGPDRGMKDGGGRGMKRGQGCCPPMQQS